jgi:hypothetical protein
MAKVFLSYQCKRREIISDNCLAIVSFCSVSWCQTRSGRMHSSACIPLCIRYNGEVFLIISVLKKGNNFRLLFSNAQFLLGVMVPDSVRSGAFVSAWPWGQSGVDKVLWASIDLGSRAILQVRVLCINWLPYNFITKFQIIKWFSWKYHKRTWSQDFVIGPGTVSIRQFLENPTSGCALSTLPLLTSQVLAVSKKKSSPADWESKLLGSDLCATLKILHPQREFVR